MAFASIQRNYLNGSEATIDAMKDCLVAAGWVLYDTIAGTNYGYVCQSFGESGDEFPCYMHIYKDGNNIRLYPYRGWNLTTHAGRQGYFNASYTYVVTPGASSWMYLYGTATKDGCLFSVYTGSIWDMAGVWLLDTAVKSPLGILTSDITAGADKVIQLGVGEADDFEVGGTYDIIDEVSRNYITVTAVDTVNHRITATLTYAFTVANYARVGYNPDHWVGLGFKAQLYAFPQSVLTTATSNAPQTTSILDPISLTALDPSAIDGKYYLVNFHVLYSGSGAIGGYLLNPAVLRAYIDTTSEHVLTVADIDDGTATSSGGTTLTDSGKSWTIDEHAGKIIAITGGTGVGQFRTIVSNTATEITVSEAWTTNPDATSTYTICEEGWIYLMRDNITRSFALRMK